MKRLLYLQLIVFLSINCFGQKLAENKVDEFTKASVKRTSWELLTKKGIYSNVRLSYIDDRRYLDIKFMQSGYIGFGGSIFSIRDGENISFKMSNDSIINLSVPKYEIACSGCGAVGLIGLQAYGIGINIPLNDSIIAVLSSTPVVKIRIYTTDGYIEADVPAKNQDLLKKEFALLK